VRAAMPAEQRAADELTWSALGSSVVLRLTDDAVAARARELTEHELAAIDRACSRFRADSELSRVNARAGRWVEVGALLIGALEVALRAAETTAGDVDATVGSALILAGYDRDFSLISGPAAVLSAAREEPPPTVYARELSDWRAVELDRGRGRVRVPRGICLDLGATAKAWAADRCAAAINDDLGCGVLVSLGGDIATAGRASSGGWRIRVTDDHRAGPGAPGQTVSVLSGGLATSSITTRAWTRAGTTMHHIIDPRRAAPVRGPWRTASVAAADCTDANVASTAALVRGAGAERWLSGLGLPARLVAHDGAARELAGWPAPGEQNERASTW